MQSYKNNLQDRKGNALAGALVTVTVTATGATATIYSDNGVTTQNNPITTDSDGEFSFYAANGKYTLTATYGGASTQTLPDVLLFDPSDSSAAGDIGATDGSSGSLWTTVQGFINKILSSVGSAYVGFIQSGTGAVATTVQEALRNFVTVKQFGAVGDGVTDDTAAIQAAINASTRVFVPDGIYMCANIVMRSNLILRGKSHNAIFKLLPNALLASYNGSQADSNGFYPGNVICSTLNHNGGTWSDGGVRALDENNSTYIFENVVIENLTIDGNKANNQIGDLGQNRSAMGAGVSIHQCKNVAVRECRIINNRMDGVHIGYTLHGGSDYCNIVANHFSGNQRTNLALITGKYNTVSLNTGEATTGGTGLNAGAALDIEANFTGEVNYRHTIVGNRLGGILGVVSQNQAKLQDTVCSGNVWLGGLSLSGWGMTQGMVIAGDTFIATSASQDWMLRYGPNTASTTDRPTLIKNCSVSGFNRVLGAIAAGGQENFIVEGCSFKTASFGTLLRGYKVVFKNNTFEFSGNADSASLIFSNTLGASVPNQGQVRFVGNRFTGVSNASFFTLSRDATWPVEFDDFVFEGNEIRVTGSTNFATDPTSVSFVKNLILNFKPVNITSLSLFRFKENTASATTAENLFANQTSTFSDVEISFNNLLEVSVNPTRPKDTTIVSNSIVNGSISILFSFTSGTVGRNHVSGNTMTAKTAVATPFSVTTGGGFSTVDFSGQDRYYGNTHVGFTGGPSIAAAVAGTYVGDFVRPIISGSATYDPANLVDGAGVTTTVTVTGAALGDFAEASFSLDLQGIMLTAWISAANTVSVRFQNETGGAVDLASGTLRVMVTKQ